jgi:serine/threonine-protein kinase
MPTLEDIRLGQLAVAHGLAQPMEVEECLAIQHRREQENNYALMGDILVEHGYLTRTQLDRLLAMQREAVQKVTRIGPYDLLRKLGEGGMGAVYQARDSRNSRTVALKVLPRSRAGSGDKVFLRRFEAEARAAFELDHPNIVRGFDYGYADGYHFLVMEYVEGQDVYQILNAKGRFNESEALHILEQIASALDHIHEEQLVHRDIKPENILITTEGVAKLTDMGLALDREEWGRRRITQAGMAMGTPYYLAPEQIQGESEADIRSDIYSLGATVYEMVTGRPPFEGETATVVMVKHLNEQVPSPHDIDKDISVGFCHILEKTMAKKPENRYQEPAELLEDIALVKQGKEPKSARPEHDQSSIARSQREQRVHVPGQTGSTSSAKRAAVEPDKKGSDPTRPEIRAAATRRAEKARARAAAASMGGIRWVILAGVVVGILTALLIILLNK